MKNRKRTAQDKIICGFNHLRFALTEPVKLRIVRAKHEQLYKNNCDKPLISVYVPTYNRAKILIERAVGSILKQSYTHFELIIIGDHCTDNTEELLSQIDDPRIKFYNLPERTYRYPESAENHWLAGPVVAANKALELVSGKWIARIDDDDMWTPDHLEELLRYAQKGNYEFVSARYIREKEGKREIADVNRARSSYYTRRPSNPKDDSPYIGGSATWLYRSYLTSIRYNINCWRKDWNRVNDIDLSQRIFHAGARMGFLDKVVTYILPRPGETLIGLKAYECAEEEKNAHFKFDSN